MSKYDNQEILIMNFEGRAPNTHSWIGIGSQAE